MPTPSGERLAALTHRTVVRGAALAGWLPTDELAGVLYRAGGQRVDPRADGRWPAQLAVLVHRGLGDRAARYDRVHTDHWFGWNECGVDPTTLSHKIYLSPAVGALAAAVPALLATAADLDVPAWKIGADLPGLARPDKIVLYLDDPDTADAIGHVLATRYAHVAVQGVPFTGQIGSTGLVSRGRDVGGESWRHLVCHRVAAALVAAYRPAEQPDLIAEHALRRLAEAGQDIRTWHPYADTGLLAAS